jgi:hypothetical protein
MWTTRPSSPRLSQWLCLVIKKLALNLQLLDAQSNFAPNDLGSYFVVTENIAK